MRRHIRLAGAFVTAGALVVAGSSASAPSRIVDRTFVCTPMAFAGVRDLDLWASPPRTEPWTIPAYLVARTGTTLPTSDLVYVRARAQGKIGWTSPFSGPAGVYAHARRCTPTRAPVALTSTGLPGPPAGWYSDVTCSLRGRVLVRVRALLTAPADWRPTSGPFLAAQRSVLEASLAVRSERTGEALAFMKLARDGGTRFWSAPRCT
jgi:hypothetical protein